MKKLSNNEWGLVFLRTTIGIAFIAHGLPKLLAGTETWTWLGEQLQVIGISFTPTFFGFMAVISEIVGGLLLMLGMLQRWAALAILCTMLIAMLMQFNAGDGYNIWSHPLKMIFVFICLAIADKLPNLWQLFFSKPKSYIS